jgi:hypothetical protein
MPTRTQQPTPTPAPAASLPELLSPAPNMAANGEVRFSWRSVGLLPPGTAYEVVWRNVEEEPAAARGIAPPTMQNSIVANLNVLYESHQLAASALYWSVIIVRLEPYERLTPVTASQFRFLTYQPPGSGVVAPSSTP